MATWEWIEIAFAVVIVVAAVGIVTVLSSRSKTRRLRQQYGREYERLVSDTGSDKAARRELSTRESQRGKLDVVPLTPAVHSDFTARWLEVQNGFVDNPAGAVRVADRLVTEVMRQRGYPVDDFERRAADITVDHPQVAENYRAAHRVQTAQQNHVSTEQQRQAFVHYRALFDRLLETTTAADGAQEQGRMTIHEEAITDSTEDDEVFFADDDLADLSARWAGVQAAFVDDPKGCVHKADVLVADLMVKQLADRFDQARARLEQPDLKQASTEELRLALMRYREFFERLLAL